MKTKDALKRYCLIDMAVKNMNRPTRQDIIDYISKKTEADERHLLISFSTFEKDLFFMRSNFDAPLYFSKSKSPGISGESGHYKYIGSYDFWKHFIKYWENYIDLPKEIKKLINE